MQRIALLRAAAAASLLLGLQAAQAQSIKPGLWEATTQMQSGSGEMEKAMAQAQAQMAALPPEQRKMMEDMMAKQGVSMGKGGANTARYCLSREMVESNNVTQQQGNCKTTASSRTGNTMKTAFTCTNPTSSGEGTVTFLGADAYNSKMNIKTVQNGKTETMSIDSTSK